MAEFSELPVPRSFSAEQEKSPVSEDEMLEIRRRCVPESD